MKQKCKILGCNKYRFKVNIVDEETQEEIRDSSEYCYEHMRLSRKPIYQGVKK